MRRWERPRNGEVVTADEVVSRAVDERRDTDVVGILGILREHRVTDLQPILPDLIGGRSGPHQIRSRVNPILLVRIRVVAQLDGGLPVDSVLVHAARPHFSNVTDRNGLHSPRPFIHPWICVSNSLISAAMSSTGLGGVYT